MGKRLKKLVYFFLKYHCPTAAQEFSKSLKLSSDDTPETTLENIYIDWKRLKCMKDDKSTQANLDLPEKKVITRQIQVILDNVPQPSKKKDSKPVKSIPDDATLIINKTSKPDESGTENTLKSKNKETKLVQSNAEKIINKAPAQFNGFIPRPVLHENTLTKVADADEAERFHKYDSVIDSVLSRVYIESQPISANIKSPTKKAQVTKEKDISSLAIIKENMQKGLNKSFLKETKTAPLADDNQETLPTKNDIANNKEIITKDVEKVPKKKKAKKDKIKALLDNSQNIQDVNDKKQGTIEILQIDNSPNKVQPDGGVMEVFSPLKSKEKKRGKAKDNSNKNEIRNSEPAKKKKKLEAEPAPTRDLLKHPVTNDFSTHNGFSSSSNVHSNSFGDNFESESPELQGVRMSKPFRRVDVYGDIKIDPKLKNNSFEAMRGATNSWGEKAYDVLKFTKGKSFKHEKTKKKRGTYSGGAITLDVNSVQFSDVDD